MNNKLLTICSVSFKSKKFLDLNSVLTKKQNNKNIYNWIVVENSPLEDSDRLSLNDKRFQVIEGYKNTDSPYYIYGSYHHAAALSLAVKNVKTRYALFLDPDYFILRPQWIKEIIFHMNKNNLALFGSPYYPSVATKYRYFPCGICLFIDLQKISKKNIDLTPEIVEMKYLQKRKISDLFKFLILGFNENIFLNKTITTEMIKSTIKKKFLSKLLGRYKTFLDVGASRDLGWKLYRKYAKNRNFKFELFQSAWKNPIYNKSESFNIFLKHFIIRHFLPDKVSWYAKKKDYTTRHSFKDFGLPDILGFGWEEYFWCNQPFGFHIKGVFQGIREVEIQKLKKILFFAIKGDV